MGLLRKIIPLVFLAIVLVAAYFWSKHGSEQSLGTVNRTKNVPNATSKTPKGMPPAHVVVNPVKVQNFYKQFIAIGNGRAIAAAELTPWSAGVIDKIYVSAGAKVHTGDVIVKLDSKREEIAVAKARVQRDNSALTLSRTLKLRATNTATEVQEIAARLDLDNANLALRDADLALDRRTIRAPIDGIVGIFPTDVGNTVTLNTVIGRIENRERVLVDVWVPERYIPHIHKGDEVVAKLIAQPEKNFVGRIYALDNKIDEESRTLHVQVEIKNEKDTLMSGMSFSIQFKFLDGLFPVVDPLAIQWNSRGSFVWRVKDGKVGYVPVSIIQHKENQVFVKAALEDGDQIIVQGVQMLYPGRSAIIDDSEAHKQKSSTSDGQDA
ncbi:efflux RND transporter periplasmic adaptor subunit [Bartonella sp. CB175]|uniref:efflux RND transporter periplasmic adaptor subunit n=1 Tax=Bartonella sp. CB175 TaxID=3112256 RepID=UPI00300E63CD